jgi:hypothetical protein
MECCTEVPVMLRNRTKGFRARVAAIRVVACSDTALEPEGSPALKAASGVEAFEVNVVAHSSTARQQLQLFSKLSTRQWPSLPVLQQNLTDFLVRIGIPCADAKACDGAKCMEGATWKSDLSLWRAPLVRGPLQGLQWVIDALDEADWISGSANEAMVPAPRALHVQPNEQRYEPVETARTSGRSAGEYTDDDAGATKRRPSLGRLVLTNALTLDDMITREHLLEDDPEPAASSDASPPDSARTHFNSVARSLRARLKRFGEKLSAADPTRSPRVSHGLL